MIGFLRKLKLFELTFFGLVALLPLVFDYWSFDIYEVTKNVLLRFSVGLLIIFYTLEVVSAKRKHFFGIRNSFYFVGALLFVLGLSLLTSIHPTTSFFGDFYRHGGVINYLLYCALFLLAQQILAKTVNQRRLVVVTIGTGTLVALYASLQSFGIDFFNTGFGTRTFSTLGNPTSLGAYLIFPFWFTLYKLQDSWKQPKLFFGFTLILTLLTYAIYTTWNRATILAIGLSLGLLIVYKLRTRWKLLVTLSLAGLILAGGVLSYFAQDLRSINSRFLIWESSLEIIKSQPIFGSGAESFALRFEEHVPENFFEYENYQHLADRPHNEPMEWWIHFGVFGLLFYISLIFALIYKFFTTKKQLDLFAILALLSLFASNFFSFSWTIHYSLLAVILGLLFTTSRPTQRIPHWFKNLAAGFFILGSLLIFWSFLLFSTNRLMLNAFKASIASDLILMEDLSQKAVHRSPFYAATHIEAFNNFYVHINTLDKEGLITKLAEPNDKANELNGGRLRTQVNKVRVLKDLQEYKLAEAILEGLYYEKSPNPVTYQIWGDLFFEQEEYAKAIVIYEEMLDLMPSHWRSPVLGPHETDEQRIFWKNHQDFVEVLDRVILSYLAIGDEAKAEAILTIIQ